MTMVRRSALDDARAEPWTVVLRADVPFGQVELVDYEIAAPMRNHMRPSDNIVELLLGEQHVDRRGHYPHIADTHAMGEMTFLLAGQDVEIEWPAVGRLRAIRCRFGGGLVQPPRRFAPEELLAALDVRSPVIRKAMQSIAEELLAPGFESSLLAGSLSAQVAVEMGRYFRRRTAFQTSGRLSAAQLALINERIEADGNVPTAGELAQECRLSKRHFFRLFRQTTGMSLADYATRRRIERAKGLLRSDTMLVKQIAYRGGFQTPSAFSAAFRRATGMTPREYRQGTGG